MASRSEAAGDISSSAKQDPGQKYCFPLEGNKNRTQCSFCGLVMKSGGITRLKFHLAHADPRNNAKKCPCVPPEVKAEILEWIHKKDSATKQKINVDGRHSS